MSAKYSGGEVGRNEAEEEVGERVVVMGGERIGRGYGVEIGVVESADAIWGGWVEDEAMDVVLQGLSSC